MYELFLYLSINIYAKVLIVDYTLISSLAEHSIYYTPISSAFFIISSWPTYLFISHLFPTNIEMYDPELGAPISLVTFYIHSSKSLNERLLDKSNTNITPALPLKLFLAID